MKEPLSSNCYRNSTKHKSRPSSRLEQHCRPGSYGSSLQLNSARLNSPSFSSCHASESIKKNLEKARSKSVPPPRPKFCSSKTLPLTMPTNKDVDNQEILDSQRDDSENNDQKTPVAAPRNKKVSHNQCAKKSTEQLYMQFMLRITEDIIRNDLYSTEEMKQVFQDHIEANRGRLNMSKMLAQIDHLCKELNIVLDNSNLDVDVLPRKEATQKPLRCTCNKALKTSSTYKCECNSTRDPPIRCEVHEETSKCSEIANNQLICIPSPTSNNKNEFVCSQQSYIEAVFYEPGPNEECDSYFIEEDKFKSESDKLNLQRDKISKLSSLSCVTEKTEPTTSTETTKCDTLVHAGASKTKITKNKDQSPDVLIKSTKRETYPNFEENISEVALPASTKETLEDNNICQQLIKKRQTEKQTGIGSISWMFDDSNVVKVMKSNNEEEDLVPLVGPVYMPKTLVTPNKNNKLVDPTSIACIVLPRIYVERDLLMDLISNQETLNIKCDDDVYNASTLASNMTKKWNNENGTPSDEEYQKSKFSMKQFSLQNTCDGQLVEFTVYNNSFSNNVMKVDENSVGFKMDFDLTPQREDVIKNNDIKKNDRLLLNDKYKINANDEPYMLPGLSEAIQQCFPSVATQTELPNHMKTISNEKIDWCLLSKDTKVENYKNNLSNREITAKVQDSIDIFLKPVFPNQDNELLKNTSSYQIEKELRNHDIPNELQSDTNSFLKCSISDYNTDENDLSSHDILVSAQPNTENFLKSNDVFQTRELVSSINEEKIPIMKSKNSSELKKVNICSTSVEYRESKQLKEQEPSAKKQIITVKKPTFQNQSEDNSIVNKIAKENGGIFDKDRNSKFNIDVKDQLTIGRTATTNEKKATESKSEDENDPIWINYDYLNASNGTTNRQNNNQDDPAISCCGLKRGYKSQDRSITKQKLEGTFRPSIITAISKDQLLQVVEEDERELSLKKNTVSEKQCDSIKNILKPQETREFSTINPDTEKSGIKTRRTSSYI